MAVTLPTLTPIQDTLWLTLCGRALDHRAKYPILGDAMADEIIRTVDYDYEKLGPWNTNSILGIAQRAKKLDEVARDFFVRHPNGIGIDLGAGLDTRAVRVDPPAWYDVDYPEVVSLRRQLISPTENADAHDVAADLTTDGWLEAIPNDRPAVIVADGLMAFLTEEEQASLVRRLIEHVPSGEVAFNGYTKFHVWAANRWPSTRWLGQLMRAPGMDDPREPEQWHPKLKLAREILLTREPEVAQFPPALRFFTRLAALSVGWSRRGGTILRYRF